MVKLNNIFRRKNNFQYILKKLDSADFQYTPFKHLIIDDFFSDEHLNIILSDKQIHFLPVKDTNQLITTLSDYDYEVIGFPGCTQNIDKYLECLDSNEWNNIHTSLADGELEGYGIAYRLNSYRSRFIQDLMEFMNGPELHALLRKKFDLSKNTAILSAVQKYLTRYEISPHPDIRRKALTYLININRNSESERLDIHTQLLAFKEDYKHIFTEWQQNTEYERFWVPWDWCETVKMHSKNNSLVMFSPDNDTLHAIKLNYDHNKTQRTQIYGNLNYVNPPIYERNNYKKFKTDPDNNTMFCIPSGPCEPKSVIT